MVRLNTNALPLLWRAAEKAKTASTWAALFVSTSSNSLAFVVEFSCTITLDSELSTDPLLRSQSKLMVKYGSGSGLPEVQLVEAFPSKHAPNCGPAVAPSVVLIVAEIAETGTKLAVMLPRLNRETSSTDRTVLQIRRCGVNVTTYAHCWAHMLD